MDMRRSRSCSGKDTIRLGRPTFQNDGVCYKRSWWRVAWNGLIRNRMMMFDNCIGVRNQRGRHHRGNYDAYSYELNFDQGRLWEEDEPENLSRSFSVRFSDPSRLKFHNQQLLDL